MEVASVSSADAAAIIAGIDAVRQERERRASDPQLAARVLAVKRHQHSRFERTYADLAAQPRYAAAARFFLDELYGPHDFTDRDSQFARIVPALVRLFPARIVATVRALAELHALSEQLDTAMGTVLASEVIGEMDYRRAWQAVGRRADRRRQIDLMLLVGRALDRYTTDRMLRQTLRLMRRPAAAAGLGALQHFLESGFDAFRAMRGAESFLAEVARREVEISDELFDQAALG